MTQLHNTSCSLDCFVAARLAKTVIWDVSATLRKLGLLVSGCKQAPPYDAIGGIDGLVSMSMDSLVGIVKGAYYSMMVHCPISKHT